MGVGVKAQFGHINIPVINCREYVYFSKAWGVNNRDSPAKASALLHNHTAKMGHVCMLSPNRKHPHLKIPSEYFTQQTILDINMIGTRSNKLKPKAIKFFISP